MTSVVSFKEGLLDRLPPVRGRLSANAPLNKVTWFRVGGPAEVMFRPQDAQDLADFIKNKPLDVDVTFIGVGSNLLIRDGGIPGVVVRLGRNFANISVDGDCISAGAGALDGNVAKVALENSLGGLEFLSGIPGTIGGALRMNAGAYGREMKDVLVEAQAISPQGELKTLNLNEMGYSYRHCDLGDAGWTFVSTRMKATPSPKETIAAEMQRIQDARGESQPIRSRTGGSTFANPEGHKAWQLVDEAGCRGLKRGGAQVSQQHCNFLINTGEATAADLEGLGEEVRTRVKETSGVELRWEIKRIGIEKGEDA
ncbi:UDP-N-acetylenolpyruvoylglucosamine reductase [Candidatus Terasakiella magnetica]|uniref:UDP-N-acetylenolpyruvoylglucosamine reductase n=1 Tax=Candidatus Terasakiella magnetica TaxID=1867952 RepID=A0A1C3RJH0_9PROT|nr:UDP-N-acetylmuramate dehydrogenase [Candidatus Terasakiella magnetica]SCA57408.1 UDP-N-acetylenolpyruvoylglucosamine reductase [Candidatus Terasakiella magnetica]